MPKKVRNNKSLIKQKKAIETRLIQISLIMDDYLYKHKQVSQHDAESYIVEIVSYNKKCYNDARSLQVIDKLTRFMKAIINEHKQTQENKLNDSNTKETTFRTDCDAPLCLLADSDKENFTQSIPEKNSTTLMKVNNATENDETKLKSILDLIVLDSDDEGPKINNSQNVFMNYSDVASQDLFTAYTQDETQIPNTDNTHSIQLSETPAKNEYLISTGSQASNNFTEIDHSETVLTNSSYVKNVLNIQKQLDNIPYSHCIVDESKGTENEVKSNAIPKQRVNNQKTEVNLKKTKNSHELINLTTAEISSLHLDSLDIPVYYEMKPIAKSVANIGDADVTKNKKGPRKQKTNVKSQENVKSKGVKCKPRKKKYQVKTITHKVSFDNNNNCPIGYKNSEDLSWVESLNYVREISTAENHSRSKDLSLSFWENYSLPNDWDNSEFEYKI